MRGLRIIQYAGVTKLRKITKYPTKKNGSKISERIKAGSKFILTFQYDPHEHITSLKKSILANYGPMIYTAPYVMLLIRANPFQGQVGGGCALEIETILGPVK
jgi:hypothetical protein